MTRRNRIGLYSLAVAAAGFLFVTFQPWIPLSHVVVFRGLTLRGLLSAFFDASLVGALADWFAVTALFRSPLGIPLPHTDILARNQEAIAEAVPRFLSSFVIEETIAGELAGVDFAGNVERLLADARSRGELNELIRSRVVGLLSAALRNGGEPSSGFAAGVREVVALVGERFDPVPAVASLLQWAHDERLDQRLFSIVASGLRSLIAANYDSLADTLVLLVRRNVGWQGLFVGRGTVERLLVGIQQELEWFGRDPSHDLRLILEKNLLSLAARLGPQGSEADPARDTVRSSFSSLVSDPATAEGIARLLAAVAARLRATLQPGQTAFDQSAGRLEDSFVAQLKANPDFRRSFNLGVAGLISSLVARSRLIEGVTGYLAALLKNTDVREFVGKVEAAVWNDLQYIRVNGAVVGGLVGVILAFVLSLT